MNTSLFFNNGTLIGFFSSGMLILFAIRNREFNFLNNVVESVGVVAVGTFVWDLVNVGGLETWQSVLITLIASFNPFSLVEFLTNTKRLRRLLLLYWRK